MTNPTRMIAALAATAFLLGCQSAAEHRRSVTDDTGERVTVGSVQRNIELGMSGAEVAEVLGSPNIVTTDEERREVWIYDKIATDSAFSDSASSGSANVLGIPDLAGAAFFAGTGSSSFSSSAGAQSTSQRTLTIVIKFDEAGQVRDYGYHTSRF